MRNILIALGLAAALVGGTVAVAATAVAKPVPGCEGKPLCDDDDMHWPNPIGTPTPSN
ncbi:hypothetical protein [Nonomuraea endophytica]|uniref:Uncharacterized protein n=1 Tax=Nonomuraea endophytica TaxID=714136 RepID=A0A7W8A5X7_9ACTN|nr:hypothetical protein [Nonomuraea endophytica]MBB5078858.1 hypothetical protein [Nonomuraea endophytica]